MSILPLPEGTVRRLGSSLTITSPVRLLKELLDNAIDAGASSIDVLVSSNTVDKIEVRDNGHGISPGDLSCLGRPGHTSKLRSFDELGTLGGATLGFRGSALASATALADVSLTTRVSTEHVATVVSLAKGGGIGTQASIGAPVGTTVSATSLFSHFPVRLQVAVKEAPKSLAEMKVLLQSYVFTRPCVRLRFTILKNPNLSWSYAPAPNCVVKEAAMQLLGTELASQCTFEIFPSQKLREDTEPSNIQNDPASSRKQDKGPIFEALLPRPGADPRKIGKGGGFLSVDSRPVSPARGTAKKLLSIFKRRLGDHFARLHSEDTPKDPFIRLNIRCPPGSYDVNVEPSKDDVLFEEEQQVIDQFESFLSFIYCTSERRDSPESAVGTDIEKAPAEVTPEHLGHRLPSQATTSLWRVDMSSGLDVLSDESENDDGSDHPQQGIQQRAEKEMVAGPENDLVEINSGNCSKEGLNPWSIAKLTGTNRTTAPRPERLVREIHQETQPRPSGSGTTEVDDGLLSNARELRSDVGLEPRRDRHNELENPASRGRHLHEVFGHESRKAPARSTRPSNRDDRPRRNRELQSPPTSSPHEHDYDGRPSRPRYAAGSSHLVQSQISFDSNNKRKRHRGQGVLDISQQPHGPSLGRHTRASTSVRRSGVAGTDVMMAAHTEMGSERGRPVLQASPHRQHSPHRVPDIAGDLGEARSVDGSDVDTAQPDLLTDDPRARLIKQQRLMAQKTKKKPRRLKTEQLPLETTPLNSETCTLLLTMTADACGLAHQLSDASRFDTWLVDGKLRGAFKNGASPEDTAMLVKPLLARIGDGATVMT
ncbi:hypothetical protein C8A00DRAFT_13604 [Chaetomidium leptoderma]|uniref:DNA mismatch repair protein S5 domain-containing protein n=1 Tax=Chaetomidium leptoderma TaxID=669021 RepID=A0AAN6VPW0_9PEZI|nr:hypothetical protein C8A00DRAFT_13604 [Chaetomidium leptoderma]